MDGSAPNFSPQQVLAIDAVGRWLKNPGDKAIFRLFGYAGTGKTTIARYLAGSLTGKVVYCAFTGKAALMMRRNGCTGASTIHSLIYTVHEGLDGAVTFKLDEESAAADAKLIVVDECSMVDEDLAKDLMSFGKPILVLGDPAQLPPVKSAGFFTEAEPDAMLTEIHRQAEGNPIIELATKVRLGETLQLGDYGTSRVVSRGVLGVQDVLKADQVLIGKNATRHTFNERMRSGLGRRGAMPEVGDRLVCLRNDKTLGIFNGGLFTVQDLPRPKKKRENMVTLKLTSEDFPQRAAFYARARKEFFLGGAEELDWRDLKNSQHFDYGYALTVHKAQGSQWSDVVVYDESAVFREDWRRWLYTAITRASERITLVV